jgi:hypothetical protein
MAFKYREEDAILDGGDIAFPSGVPYGVITLRYVGFDFGVL